MMSSSDRTVQSGTKRACVLCRLKFDYDIVFGKYIQKENFCVHANCLFFASGLHQHGDLNDDLFGFLEEDIRSEFQRGKNLVCFYCRKRGATIDCCDSTCGKIFHFHCGLYNGALHEFFDRYNSYCNEHMARQPKIEIESDLHCFLCHGVVERDNDNSCLYAPCCKKIYFHKVCLQKYAFDAGKYFFKCPVCDNLPLFSMEMKKYGIHIPPHNSYFEVKTCTSWELQLNQYHELLPFPKCNAQVCSCPKGREYCPKRKSFWTLVVCPQCGSNARHKKCGNIQSEDRWMCEKCTDVNDESM